LATRIQEVFKANGVFSEHKGVKTADQVLEHVQKCPTTVYKVWSKDRKLATRWCESTSQALGMKRMTKQPITKATNTKSKYELHLEYGQLWVIHYEKVVENEH